MNVEFRNQRRYFARPFYLTIRTQRFGFAIGVLAKVGLVRYSRLHCRLYRGRASAGSCFAAIEVAGFTASVGW